MLKTFAKLLLDFISSYNGKQILYALLYNLFSGFLTYYLLTQAIELSSFGIGLMKFSLGLTSWVIFDVLVLKDIDTLEAIKNGNIAVALIMGFYMIAISLMIGLA